MNNLFKPIYINLLPTENKTASKLATDANVAFKPYYDKSDEEVNKLFEQMINSASKELLSWSVSEIANWEFNEPLKCPFYHIHGTFDLIFSIKNIDRYETLKGATHCMIYNNAEEVCKRIEARIKLLPSIK